MDAPGQVQRSRRAVLAVSACLVVGLGLSLFLVSRADRGDQGSDTTSGLSTPIATTPRALTSIPFCDDPAVALSESDDGPQQPDESFWAREQRISDYGFAVEAAYGSSATWSGWYIAPDRSLVFRFTDRDPERDAAIGAIVEGHPHSFLQVGFTVAERQQAHDRLIEAWEAAGQGFGLTGIGIEGPIPLVEIELNDHDQVESFAEQIGLEPPYDIYCINPREIHGE